MEHEEIFEPVSCVPWDLSLDPSISKTSRQFQRFECNLRNCNFGPRDPGLVWSIFDGMSCKYQQISLMLTAQYYLIDYIFPRPLMLMTGSHDVWCRKALRYSIAPKSVAPWQQ